MGKVGNEHSVVENVVCHVNREPRVKVSSSKILCCPENKTSLAEYISRNLRDCYGARARKAWNSLQWQKNTAQSPLQRRTCRNHTILSTSVHEMIEWQWGTEKSPAWCYNMKSITTWTMEMRLGWPETTPSYSPWTKYTTSKRSWKVVAHNDTKLFEQVQNGAKVRLDPSPLWN